MLTSVRLLQVLGSEPLSELFRTTSVVNCSEHSVNDQNAAEGVCCG